MIPNLANLATLKLGSGGGSTVRKKAYSFDGSTGYISGDTTIGRTGYDLNVSGNVSTGSDADGSYFWINGNRDATAVTGTVANMGPNASLSYTQLNSFTIKCRVKFSSLPANNVSGVFGSASSACLHVESGTQRLRYTIRGSTTVNVDYTTALVVGTLYDFYLSYDATSSKFYAYYALSGGSSTLVNAGGTAGPATFTAASWSLGDNAIGAGSVTSSNKNIYHACIRNKALSQSEIDADIALGNSTKNDPNIVAYYIPENLTYNTQYLASPKALDNATWTKSAGVTVTANTTVAPDGTTTADTVSISGASGTSLYQTNTTISGATIASKTFIVKAFVKVPSGTANFRLEASHAGVSSTKSADFTATTTRQEFTFTQTFTSSTSGTGVTGAIVNDSLATNPTLEVRNVRLFLANETLRDESPNTGGFIGWKTPVVMSTWVKLGIDSISNTTKQVAFQIPRHYLQLRDTTNILYFRSETTLTARAPGLGGSAILGTGNRNKVHILGVKWRDGTGRLYKAYVNGVQTTGAQTAYSNTIRPASTIYRTNASLGFYTTDYFSGNERDARIYTHTGTFTDADALAIYNGGEPTSIGITKYLRWRPSSSERGTTSVDWSSNNRTGTLTGGVTRVNI